MKAALRLSQNIRLMHKILFAIAIFACLMTEAQMKTQYTNPILSGFYPDPSICRVKDDYYLVASTFAYFPGIPVFHSKDLVHWELAGHVMSRPEQMDLTGFGVSRGIFAPAIHFHKGLFYVTSTLVDGKGNFIVTAKNVAGPWTNPVWLPEINGIDPSLFFDDDGVTYIVYNSIAPDNRPLYDGHRTIRMRRFDLDRLQVTGEERILVNGGTDISKKPRWIEGPHIFKKWGWYYLVAAQGGTGYDHSVVAFRTKDLNSPFLPSASNPILTQNHLDSNRKDPVTSTGHAQLIELPNGKWQAVFLGCRPYEGDHYNTGRETFLAPVHWKDEWPVINDPYDAVQYYYPLPLPSAANNSNRAYSGNFSYTDNFRSDSLDKDWLFLRTPKEKWYSLTAKKDQLSIQLRPQTCAGKDNPSFLGRRQQHQHGSVSTAVEFSPAGSHEKAGLVVFQNEDHFYFLCLSEKDEKPVVQLYRSLLIPADTNRMQLVQEESIALPKGQPVFLKIEASKNVYAFYYGFDGESWKALSDGMDARLLSTHSAGGFVGCVFALYATSLGRPSTSRAAFHFFHYDGRDKMYSPD